MFIQGCNTLSMDLIEVDDDAQGDDDHEDDIPAVLSMLASSSYG